MPLDESWIHIDYDFIFPPVWNTTPNSDSLTSRMSIKIT